MAKPIKTTEHVKSVDWQVSLQMRPGLWSHLLLYHLQVVLGNSGKQKKKKIDANDLPSSIKVYVTAILPSYRKIKEK